MSFGLIYLALIGANLYLSRVDKLQGDPEAEKRPWLHKSGNWSVMCSLSGRCDMWPCSLLGCHRCGSLVSPKMLRTSRSYTQDLMGLGPTKP